MEKRLPSSEPEGGEMNVYFNTSFKGHYPVGTSVLVIAENHQEAAQLLERELAEYGLAQEVKPYEMQEVKTDKKRIRILQTGDY